MKEIVIKKEDAVFWMDQSGCWRNSSGKFRKKKVIDLFHQSIAKDDDGYFIAQVRDGILEKVYFRVEDTAFFVFEVLINDDIILTLNTGKLLALDPGNLYVRDDHLYLDHENERIKFSERAMMQISSIIEEEGDHLVIYVRGNAFPIPEAPSSATAQETTDHFYQPS
ncbi:MAG: MFS transporter permease [Desulfobacterales bacterium CG23_combo_of_CG06-09_8_20_14_all_51_8]|nr:MAG: MFS transporter permease [Desulfobacterales bacterium CG23_combo_of_CG06-09_8_20_14_all_51_8]